jgi:hypothetical protein
MGSLVPFADVKAMCKYVGDKVGNRPITAVRECPQYGKHFGNMEFGFVPITAPRPYRTVVVY